MVIAVDMGTTPGGLPYFMLQDAEGQPRVFLGTPDMIEELARDLLDLVDREYCLPYICDHLDVEDRRS